MKSINWRYAIGEIIIVIIGISIAFALNNWATQRKDSKVKKQYLQGLILDQKNEMEHLESNIAKLKNNIAAIEALYLHIGKNLPRKDTVISKLFNLGKTIDFAPKNFTYNSLINSGDFKLIEDFNLKNEIEKHYSGHKTIESNYQRVSIIHEKYLGPFFMNEINYNTLQKGDFSFLDKPQLTNVLRSLYGSFTLAIEASAKGIESNKKIIALISNQN